VGFGSAGVVVAVPPEAADLLELGIAGGKPQLAVPMGHNRIPVLWMAQQVLAEQVGLM
jgi:hypothetical protein